MESHFEPLYQVSGRIDVPDEATTFVIPEGSLVWYHDGGGHYEGVHTRKEIARIGEGEWAAPPLTIKLAGSAGYALITEGALMHGMPGWYFDLTVGAVFGLDRATRRHRATHSDSGTRMMWAASQLRRKLRDPIATPWRVVMIGANLNTLVNCDIVNSVSPPPDARLFPHGLKTEWIKPGRAVWKYLDGGENTLADMKGVLATGQRSLELSRERRRGFLAEMV